MSDDPPDRIGLWVTSVGTAEVRALDLKLLVDLLTIESDATRWKGVTTVVVSHIEDLLLVGDFGGAIQLTSMLANEASGEGDREARGCRRVGTPWRRHDDDARRHSPSVG